MHDHLGNYKPQGLGPELLANNPPRMRCGYAGGFRYSGKSVSSNAKIADSFDYIVFEFCSRMETPLWMAGRLRAAALRAHIRKIFSRGARKNMRRVAARGVVATVTRMPPPKRAMHRLTCDPMGVVALSVGSHLPVSPVVSSSGPLPALIRLANGHIMPKRALKRTELLCSVWDKACTTIKTVRNAFTFGHSQ